MDEITIQYANEEDWLKKRPKKYGMHPWVIKETSQGAIPVCVTSDEYNKWISVGDENGWEGNTWEKCPRLTPEEMNELYKRYREEQKGRR